MMMRAEAALRSGLPDASRIAPRLLTLGSAWPADADDRLLAGLLKSDARVETEFLIHDGQHSMLSDAMTRLDEFHPAAAEARLFERHRDEIARHLPRNMQWLELTCGDARKSREWLGTVAPMRYIGIDRSAELVRPAMARISQYGGIETIGIVADIGQPMGLKTIIDERPGCPPVFFAPGASIGRYGPTQSVDFLRRLFRAGGLLGRLVIGVDGCQDKAQCEGAYDDPSGVSAACNRDVLRVINRQLAADFTPHDYAHRAFYSTLHSRIELRLAAMHEQSVRFARFPGMARTLASGETLVTEYAYKYPLATFGKMLNRAGYRRHQAWTDDATGYSVILAAP